MVRALCTGSLTSLGLLQNQSHVDDLLEQDKRLILLIHQGRHELRVEVAELVDVVVALGHALLNVSPPIRDQPLRLASACLQQHQKWSDAEETHGFDSPNLSPS